MRRTGIARPDPIDPVTGKRRFSTFKEPTKVERQAASKWQARAKPLERSAMKRKARRAKPGDDAKYLKWIRSLFCLVGGPKKRDCRGRLDPHHMIGGRGDQKRGKGQTVGDMDTISLCRRHHDDFHNERGFCHGWTKEGRRVWQEEEILRLRRVYEQLQLLEIS